jgi:hypothetical protein
MLTEEQNSCLENMFKFRCWCREEFQRVLPDLTAEQANVIIEYGSGAHRQRSEFDKEFPEQWDDETADEIWKLVQGWETEYLKSKEA